jgi:hypothetical protein
MPHKEHLKKFDAMLKGTSDSATRDLLESLQKSLAYCLEENAALRGVLQEHYHCKSPRLNTDFCTTEVLDEKRLERYHNPDLH